MIELTKPNGKNYLYNFIENDKKFECIMHIKPIRSLHKQTSNQPNGNSLEIILCTQTKLRIKAKNAKIEQMYFSLYCLCFSSR